MYCTRCGVQMDDVARYCSQCGTASPSVAAAAAAAANVDVNPPAAYKPLVRLRGDRWLGGVCGGLGKVSGVESWVWRLVFALCTIFAGFGFLIYLLMWIFVPEE